MILFLNFAPLNFGGGAERWMLDVSTAISKLEEVNLIDVHSSISNIYSRLVLKNPFKQRININKKDHSSLKIISFIPFTTKWKQTRTTLKNARIIYIRYELLETLIVLYFGGFSAIKNTD